MQDWLKPGRVGPWEIRNFEVDRLRAQQEALRCLLDGDGEIPALAGWYTGLYHDKRGIVMSDTRWELRYLHGKFDGLLRSAQTNLVHISGLGLGIFPKYALERGFDVEIVEIEWDVIQLTGNQLIRWFDDNHLKHQRLEIIHGDALTWNPPKGREYAVAWHDIWDEIGLDNLEDYKKLRRKWGHYAREQAAWGDDHIKRMQRDEREGLW